MCAVNPFESSSTIKLIKICARTFITEIFEEKINEQYINKRRQQERLALALSRISPTSVFSLATTELAGTSLGLQNRYMDSAQDYQQVYNNFMTEKTGTGGMSGFRMIISTNDDSGEEPETIDASELPEFQFQTATLSTAASKSIFDLGLLILFNIVFFGGAFFAFLKYDLR